MRSTPMWSDGGHVVTKFMIVQSAYPGQYFIFVDEELSGNGDFMWEQMEAIKAKIRESRGSLDPIDDRKIQRYSADEVATFLRRIEKL